MNQKIKNVFIAFGVYATIFIFNFTMCCAIDDKSSENLYPNCYSNEINSCKDKMLKLSIMRCVINNLNDQKSLIQKEVLDNKEFKCKLESNLNRVKILLSEIDNEKNRNDAVQLEIKEIEDEFYQLSQNITDAEKCFENSKSAQANEQN